MVYFPWSQWICLAGCLSLPTRCVDQRAGNQTGNCYSYVGKLSGKPFILVYCIFLIWCIYWCQFKIKNLFGGTFFTIFQEQNECMFVHHTVWFVRLICLNWFFLALFAKLLFTFTRRFYPKRLTIAFRLYIFISTCVPWESNPQPFAQQTQCSTTEPHRNTGTLFYYTIFLSPP